MTYILLIILTVFLMLLNWKLLDIPGFFYYSAVRPILKQMYLKKLSMVEDVFYWEIVGAVGTMAHLSLVPAYVMVFDILRIQNLWVGVFAFFIFNYLWWLIYAHKKIEEYIRRTPALRPRQTAQNQGQQVQV